MSEPTAPSSLTLVAAPTEEPEEKRRKSRKGRPTKAAQTQNILVQLENTWNRARELAGIPPMEGDPRDMLHRAWLALDHKRLRAQAEADICEEALIQLFRLQSHIWGIAERVDRATAAIVPRTLEEIAEYVMAVKSKGKKETAS